MVNSRSCCLPLWCREKREVALVIKILPANAGDVRNTGWISGLGRSPEKENCSPFPYSCLENPMDRGAWTAGSYVAWATVHGVTKSQTRLRTHAGCMIHYCVGNGSKVTGNDKTWPTHRWLQVTHKFLL